MLIALIIAYFIVRDHTDGTVFQRLFQMKHKDAGIHDAGADFANAPSDAVAGCDADNDGVRRWRRADMRLRFVKEQLVEQRALASSSTTS